MKLSLVLWLAASSCLASQAMEWKACAHAIAGLHLGRWEYATAEEWVHGCKEHEAKFLARVDSRYWEPVGMIFPLYGVAVTEPDTRLVGRVIAGLNDYTSDNLGRGWVHAFVGKVEEIIPEPQAGDLPYYRARLLTPDNSSLEIGLSGNRRLFVLRDGKDLALKGPLQNRLNQAGQVHPDLGEPRIFSLDQVLTVVTGITLVADIDRYKEIWAYLLGVDVQTLERSEVLQNAFRSHRWVLQQYPELARLDITAVNETNWKEWLQQQRETLKTDSFVLYPMVVPRPGPVLHAATVEEIATRLRDLKELQNEE